MCRAARLDAAIEVARVPLSRAARAALAAEPALIKTILTGGDDYEVLAGVPARNVERLRVAAKVAGVAITEIGRFSGGTGRAHFVDRDGGGFKFARPSFSHF
jgi:thiamine-monophosphate kinase